jgi:hypothetical protein
MVDFSQEIGLPILKVELMIKGGAWALGGMLTLYIIFSRSILTDSSLDFAYRRYPTLPDAIVPVGNAQIREGPIIDIYTQIYRSIHLPMLHIVHGLW